MKEGLDKIWVRLLDNKYAHGSHPWVQCDMNEHSRRCSYHVDDFDAKWMMLVSSQVSSNGRIEDLDAQWI